MKDGKYSLGKIGVLMGGYSSEREISLKSGKAVYEALKQESCDVIGIDIVEKTHEDIKERIRGSHIDVAFIALHGRLGEDGEIQTILGELDIPYTGSSAVASRNAFDKAVTQKILRENNIPIPPFTVLSKFQSADKDLLRKIGPVPVVVKPACEGSSIGVTIVKAKEDLLAALNLAWKYGDTILVEKFIEGREVTVGILNGQVLPIIEIKPNRPFFDFVAKYNKGETEYVIPAGLPKTVAARIQEMALAAFQATGCAGMARIDFMLDSKNRPYALEINTIPGFTATSLLPMAAKHVGKTFGQLCLELTKSAYGKETKQNRESIPVKS